MSASAVEANGAVVPIQLPADVREAWEAMRIAQVPAVGGRQQTHQPFWGMQLAEWCADASKRQMLATQGMPPRNARVHQLVHAWVGILCNIAGNAVGGVRGADGSAAILEELKPFNAQEVILFAEGGSELRVAAVVFPNGLTGYDDVWCFDRSFVTVQRGKANWRGRGRSKAGAAGLAALYGWMADGEDYSEQSALGDYWRGEYKLRTMAEIQGEAVDSLGLQNQQLRATNMSLATRLQRCEQGAADAAARWEPTQKEIAVLHRQGLEGARVNGWAAAAAKVRTLEGRVQLLEADLKGWQAWYNLKAPP